MHGWIASGGWDMESRVCDIVEGYLCVDASVAKLLTGKQRGLWKVIDSDLMQHSKKGTQYFCLLSWQNKP